MPTRAVRTDTTDGGLFSDTIAKSDVTMRMIAVKLNETVSYVEIPENPASLRNYSLL